MIHAIEKNGQKGFTLVEVIVVAVIVAALAGVAVPVYLGYVNSSRLNAATNTAGAVASFMGSCKNATGNVLAEYPAQLRAADDQVTGAATLTCNIPGNTDPTVSIPPQITVQLRNQAANVAGAAIRAQHTQNVAEWSPEYSY